MCAHTPRLRHDWLARVALHQLSCQPRGEAGLATASVLGPSRPRLHAAACLNTPFLLPCLDDVGRRTGSLEASIPSPLSLACPAEGLWKKPTNCRENLERKSFCVPASPHPQVTSEPEVESRKVLGAILGECRCRH